MSVVLRIENFDERELLGFLTIYEKIVAEIFKAFLVSDFFVMRKLSGDSLAFLLTDQEKQFYTTPVVLDKLYINCPNQSLSENVIIYVLEILVF